MPTYAYQCQACAHAFDAFQKFAEDPLTVCPECQGPIRRVIHPTPVVFKGSGWYINDSKAANKKGAEAAKPKDDGGDAKPDTRDKTEKADKAEKTETPAAKTEQADKAKPVAASAD